MKDVQCYELFGGIALKNHAFSFFHFSCALDPIQTSLLFRCLDGILPTLTQIINTSILSGQFPTNMKNAIVKPLQKMFFIGKL